MRGVWLSRSASASYAPLRIRSEISGVGAWFVPRTEARISRYEYSPRRICEAYLLLPCGTAKEEPSGPEAYFPILLSSASVMVGCGMLILVLN